MYCYKLPGFSVSNEGKSAFCVAATSSSSQLRPFNHAYTRVLPIPFLFLPSTVLLGIAINVIVCFQDMLCIMAITVE